MYRSKLCVIAWWMALGMIIHVFPSFLLFTPSVVEQNGAKIPQACQAWHNLKHMNKFYIYMAYNIDLSAVHMIHINVHFERHFFMIHE